MNVSPLAGKPAPAAMLVNVAKLVTLSPVYKSPTCGCCEKYVDYLRDNGFAVKA